jgi:glyoxylase-like metal-dependent hydrolase (beta-lactamase superfamily II)
MTGGAPSSKARVFTIGEAKITPLKVGDFGMSLYDIFGRDSDLTRYFGPRELATAPFYPSNTFLIVTPSNKIIVDPGDRERLLQAYGPQPPNAPRAPSSLVEQLGDAGVKPSEIDTVVVTHLHYDHFAGVTHREGGKTIPSFPEANHIIPRRDWDMAEIAKARRRGDKDLTETLGAVEDAGLVSFLDGEKKLGGDVTIYPAPGESPGHQILGVLSRDATCYCVGDLYHLKEEVEHPELAATWADAQALARSRKAFAERASNESALILPGHMRPGRISIKDGSPTWSEE